MQNSQSVGLTHATSPATNDTPTPATAGLPSGCRGLSRRGFIHSTAALLAAAALKEIPITNGAAPEAAKPKVLVGGHPWVYAATQPKYDITPCLPAIFADMSYAGLDGIELMHTALRPNDSVDRIGDLSQKHKLPVIGMSFSGAMWDRTHHQAVLDDAALVVPRLAKLSGRTMGTSVETPGRQKTAEQLDDQAELLRKLVALCQSHGVVLNLHNHTYEVTDNLHDLKGTLARIPEVKLGPDLNWLFRGGVDPVWFIRQFGQQIVFLHLRDQKKNGRWSEALGEGETDFKAIAQALREVGFHGNAVIELAHENDFRPTRPLRESFKISRNFVKGTLGY